MGDTLMHTYTRQPVVFTHGEGAWLWDDKGNRYLDALSGIAVCGLGHAHPEITRAICEQAGKLLHTSNIYQVEKQQLLADRLNAISGMDRVFFCNSGAEANEAAIKLARLYGHKKEISVPEIIVMENSFHGRTLATLTATGNRKVQAGFEPLVQGFVRAPFNDLEALRNIGKNRSSVVAILVEPIQGESGIRVPSTDYLNGVREICDQNGWLMMLDEIQTGMARTGKWFAHQHNGIKPDVMTLAKGLGNGMPIGACLANGAAADILQPGNHGSTFGGNPLACNTALAVIDVIEKNNLLQRAATLGEKMNQAFLAQLQDIKGVTEIRARGMMFGIELDRPCADLVGMGLKENILINVAGEKSVRLLPPLIISDEEADQIVRQVCDLIRKFLSA